MNSPARSPVDVVVQYHPSREQTVARVLDKLPAATVLIADPAPHAGMGAWRTYQRCLERAGDRSLLVVQDDVILCGHVAEACEQIAAQRPGDLVALYVGRQPTHLARQIVHAAEAGERWAGPLRLSTWCPAVALLWPPALARRCAVEAKAVAPADDAVIGRWVHRNRISLYAVAPSLVEHPDDVPSLMGQRWGTSWRRAACFLGADRDARELWPPPEGV